LSAAQASARLIHYGMSSTVTSAGVTLASDVPEYAGAKNYPSHTEDYDYLVYEINCRFGWGVSRHQIQATYDKFAGRSNSHCEVGLASPSFLLRAVSTSASVLCVDVDQHWLSQADNTLKDIGFVKRQTCLHSITHPLPAEHSYGLYESLGLNFVLHCVTPDEGLGPTAKGVAFQHLKALLAPGGVVFGSTILGDGADHTSFGTTVMDSFNSNGIFANRLDSAEDLCASLSAAFARFEVAQVGATVIFVASDDPSKDLTLPLDLCKPEKVAKNECAGGTGTAGSSAAQGITSPGARTARWANLIAQGQMARAIDESRSVDLDGLWRPL